MANQAEKQENRLIAVHDARYELAKGSEYSAIARPLRGKPRNVVGSSRDSHVQRPRDMVFILQPAPIVKGQLQVAEKPRSAVNG